MCMLQHGPEVFMTHLQTRGWNICLLLLKEKEFSSGDNDALKLTMRQVTTDKSENKLKAS